MVKPLFKPRVMMGLIAPVKYTAKSCHVYNMRFKWNSHPPFNNQLTCQRLAWLLLQRAAPPGAPVAFEASQLLICIRCDNYNPVLKKEKGYLCPQHTDALVPWTWVDVALHKHIQDTPLLSVLLTQNWVTKSSCPAFHSTSTFTFLLL